MCMGKKTEEKTTTGCGGKCSGSGQAKLSEAELEKQQQVCHGDQKGSAGAGAAE